MELTSTHYKLKSFIDLLRNSGHITAGPENNTKLFDKYFQDPAQREKFHPVFQKRISNIEKTFGIKVLKDQELAFTLFSTSLIYQIVDHYGPGNPLDGGFALGGVPAAMIAKSDRWKKWHSDFLKYESSSKEELELLDQLICYNRRVPSTSTLANDFYGCVIPNAITFPSDFFLYDRGLIYRLPFRTYQGYIDAMIDCAAVNGWQYFYIDPQELIDKNRGLNYMTTSLKTSYLHFDNRSVYTYYPNLKIDRLDLIVEHLTYCIQVLPSAFPTMDFSNQVDHVNQIRNLL